MVDVFREFLGPAERNSESVRSQLRREILALNGKPSIHQMERFHEFAATFGVAAPAPQTLLELYTAKLRERIKQRTAGLSRHGSVDALFVVAGAFPLLAALEARGLRLIILSGTADPEVKEEAALLRLAPFFREHIYGSTHGSGFSKRGVIDRLMNEEGISGSNLLAFGDGPVEIECIKAVGGIAVGVASDEQTNGSGLMDPDKHECLSRAGADAIIPDYRNLPWILERFFP